MKNRNFETLRNRNRRSRRRTFDGGSPDDVGRMILSDLKTAVQASHFAGEQSPSHVQVLTDEWELSIPNHLLLKSKTGFAQ